MAKARSNEGAGPENRVDETMGSAEVFIVVVDPIPQIQTRWLLVCSQQQAVEVSQMTGSDVTSSRARLMMVK